MVINPLVLCTFSVPSAVSGARKHKIVLALRKLTVAIVETAT